MDPTKRQITKIAREVSKLTVRTLRRDGIGSGELDVLHIIRKNPGITQAEICQITGLDKGALARQTASLETKGYLIRQANPADGRSRLLYATEQAQQLKSSKAHIEALFYEWLLTEALSQEESQLLAQLLDRVYQCCKAESKSGFLQIEKLIATELQTENSGQEMLPEASTEPRNSSRLMQDVAKSRGAEDEK